MERIKRKLLLYKLCGVNPLTVILSLLMAGGCYVNGAALEILHVPEAEMGAAMAAMVFHGGIMWLIMSLYLFFFKRNEETVYAMPYSRKESVAAIVNIFTVIMLLSFLSELRGLMWEAEFLCKSQPDERKYFTADCIILFISLCLNLGAVSHMAGKARDIVSGGRRYKFTLPAMDKLFGDGCAEVIADSAKYSLIFMGIDLIKVLASVFIIPAAAYTVFLFIIAAGALIFAVIMRIKFMRA